MSKGSQIFKLLRHTLCAANVAALLVIGFISNATAQSKTAGVCENPADAAAFGAALKLDTRAAYGQYLADYPLACFLERANQLRIEREDDEAWANARKENSRAAYKIYLDRYPDGRYTARAFEALRGLSSAPNSASNPDPVRRMNSFVDVVLKGSIVGTSLMATPDQCASDCNSNSQCVAYSLNLETKLCLLLSSVDRGIINPDFASGSSVDVPRIEAKPAEPADQVEQPRTTPTSTFSVLNATDIPGYDLDILRDVSVIDCQRACTNNQSCGAYTYNIPNNVCFLKTGVGNTEFNPDAYSVQRR